MAVRLSSSGPGTVQEHLLRRPFAGEVQVLWLGQAGFLIRSETASVVIDPYLSDSLAEKYRGRQFAHTRMTPVPVAPGSLSGVTAILATHAHTDHLDPGTLPDLAAANPRAVFVIPRAHRDLAVVRGVPAHRMSPVGAGETVTAGGARIVALPSAHESRQQDADGNDLYLGYIIETSGLRLYHSGDSVPYDGLANLLKAVGVDAVLLPINGRDEYRRSRGVPGNFTAREAYALARDSGASYLVGHHFGLFDFNTVTREEAEEAFEQERRGFGHSVSALLPEIGVSYTFSAAS